MNEEPNIRPGKRPASEFSQQIGRQEARSIKARSQKRHALWLGFSVSGLIGWGVVIPSLLGLGTGIWIDSHYAAMHCWTLMLFAFGLCVGCFNGWYWISKEMEAMRRDQEENTETHGQKNE